MGRGDRLNASNPEHVKKMRHRKEGIPRAILEHVDYKVNLYTRLKNRIYDAKRRLRMQEEGGMCSYKNCFVHLENTRSRTCSEHKMRAMKKLNERRLEEDRQDNVNNINNPSQSAQPLEPLYPQPTPQPMYPQPTPQPVYPQQIPVPMPQPVYPQQLPAPMPQPMYPQQLPVPTPQLVYPQQLPAPTPQPVYPQQPPAPMPQPVYPQEPPAPMPQPMYPQQLPTPIPNDPAPLSPPEQGNPFENLTDSEADSDIDERSYDELMKRIRA